MAAKRGYTTNTKKIIGEARNLSHLKHEGIINVLESFEENNTVYYSMEFMGGGCLDDLIKRKKRLSEGETLRIVDKIAEALEYMHSRQMLHLDLKPSNIMLTDDKRPVLIDFGLSKQYDANGNPETSTTIGAGTPGYAPLEQANFNKEMSGGLPVTMDIYALGGTMFKMLSGYRPPVASDILNYGLRTGTLQQIGVSPQTSILISRAMAPMLKDRIPSIAAFRSALHKITLPQEESDESEETDISNTTEETEKPEEAKKTIELIEVEPEPEPEPHKKKNRKTLWLTIILAILTPLLIMSLVSGIRSCNQNNNDDNVIDDNVNDKVENAFKNGTEDRRSGGTPEITPPPTRREDDTSKPNKTQQPTSRDEKAETPRQIPNNQLVEDINGEAEVNDKTDALENNFTIDNKVGRPINHETSTKDPHPNAAAAKEN